MLRVETFVFRGAVRSKKNSKEIGVVCTKPNAPGSYRKGNRWYKKVIKCSDRFYEWHDVELARLLESQTKAFVSPFKIVYRFYLGDLRIHDGDNQVTSINDLLVDAGIIPDDRLDYLRSLQLEYVHYDWEDPRVEVDIVQLPRTDHCEALGILRDKERLKAIAKAEKTTQIAIERRCKEILGRPPQALITEKSNEN